MRTDCVSGPLGGQPPIRPIQPARPAPHEGQPEDGAALETGAPEPEPVAVLRMVPTPVDNQRLPSQEAARALALDLTTMIARDPGLALEAQGALLTEDRVERLLA